MTDTSFPLWLHSLVLSHGLSPDTPPLPGYLCCFCVSWWNNNPALCMFQRNHLNEMGDKRLLLRRGIHHWQWSHPMSIPVVPVCITHTHISHEHKDLNILYRLHYITFIIVCVRARLCEVHSHRILTLTWKRLCVAPLGATLFSFFVSLLFFIIIIIQSRILSVNALVFPSHISVFL